jgi:hypothetical protein
VRKQAADPLWISSHWSESHTRIGGVRKKSTTVSFFYSGSNATSYATIAGRHGYRCLGGNEQDEGEKNGIDKTVECRATGRPRSSLRQRSIANSIHCRLGSPNHDSKTFYNAAQQRLNTEPQGVPEALDRPVRSQIQFSISWARQITHDSRPSTMEHKNGRIPNHRASQKLSTAPFASKLDSLSLGLAKLRFYDILQWNTKTAEYRATRHEIKNSLYQSIDLEKFFPLGYARESETPK